MGDKVSRPLSLNPSSYTDSSALGISISNCHALLVEEAFPVCGYPARRPRHRLTRRMRVRAGQLGTVKSFSRSIVVEPILPRLEAIDDRMAGFRAVLRRMLARRTVAAADVPAFGASAQVQPPSVCSQALDATRTAWFRVQIDSFSFTLHDRSQFPALWLDETKSVESSYFL